MSRYDIAIVGMGCRLPDALSIDRYWEHIAKGTPSFKAQPSGRWHQSLSRASIEGFDFPFLKYRLPPNAMRGVDLAQMVALEATRDALDDARLDPRSAALVDGVTVLGASSLDALAHAAICIKRHHFLDELEQLLLEKGLEKQIIDALSEEMAGVLEARGHVWNPSVTTLGGLTSSITNRIAQVFGVRGFNMTIDADFASSLAAINIACQALLAGDARIAVAGGVDLSSCPIIALGLDRLGLLSATGSSNPFDLSADGIVLGEGAGVVVLKRLEDALDDGDRVRAVIGGIGIAGPGARPAKQEKRAHVEAIRAALARAEVAPDGIAYVEACAPSIPEADASEYNALAEVYGQDRPSPLSLGSVKHQIGHLRAAAGVAGLIKLVLAMEQGTIPHMPRFEALTRTIETPSKALRIPKEIAPWQEQGTGVRVGALSDRSLRGHCAHAIVAAPVDSKNLEVWSKGTRRHPVERRVAVVGVSCQAAGADHVGAFWQHINRTCQSCVEAESSKPKLGIELATELLRTSGFIGKARGQIGVSIGAVHGEALAPLWPALAAPEWTAALRECPSSNKLDPDLLEEALSTTTQRLEDRAPSDSIDKALSSWIAGLTASDVAAAVDARRGCLVVDTASSSGLAALLPAIYQLMQGDADLVVSGGLNRQMSEAITSGLSALGVVAQREGSARPFDTSGAGFLLGEGGALFLLKRHDDALRDGDDIIAVFESVSGASEADGKSMIAPSEEAVSRSIGNALSKASSSGDSLGVVDAHGSGNPVSDLVEARALASELRREDNTPPLGLTAASSHFGHLFGGGAAVSLLSIITSLHTRTIPAMGHLEQVRPEIAELSSRVSPAQTTVPLGETFQKGGVNSLGLGGAHYFAVVQAQPDAPAPRDTAIDRSTEPHRESMGEDIDAARTEPLIDPSFHAYLSVEEPAVLALLQEAHGRFDRGISTQEQRIASPQVLPTEPSNGAPTSETTVVAEGVSLWVDLVKQYLAEVTGYPADLLDADLDLGVDLGLSAKEKAAIWSTLGAASKVGPGSRPWGLRTIGQLSTALAEMGQSLGESTGVPLGSQSSDDEAAPEIFVLSSRPADPSGWKHRPCRRILIVGPEDGAVTEALFDGLLSEKPTISMTKPSEICGLPIVRLDALLREHDTLIYAAHMSVTDLLPDGEVLRKALDSSARQLLRAIKTLAPSLSRTQPRLVIPVVRDGCGGAGPSGRRRILAALPAGLFRALPMELAGCAVQLIDVGDQPWSTAIAGIISRVSPWPEVGLCGGEWRRPTLEPLARASEIRSELPTVGRGDLVVVTGDRRGPAFSSAKTLAGATGCKLLLTGTTSLSGPVQDAKVDLDPGIRTRAELDKALRDLEVGLVRREGLGLRHARRLAAEVMMRWEVHSDLDTLHSAGLEARYEVCDVSSPRSLRGLIERVSKDEDIRGFIHGAEVAQSRLITELDESSLMHTIDATVGPLFTLLDVLDWSRANLLWALGSTTALYGAPGLAHEGLAHDILASLVLEIGAMYPHIQARTFLFPPRLYTEDWAELVLEGAQAQLDHRLIVIDDSREGSHTNLTIGEPS